MHYDLKSMGIRIRELRRKRGWTQDELAARLNISDRHMRNIESGKCGVSIDLLVEIADIFGISTDYIVLGKTHANNQLEQQLVRLEEMLVEILKCL